MKKTKYLWEYKPIIYRNHWQQFLFEMTEAEAKREFKDTAFRRAGDEKEN